MLLSWKEPQKAARARWRVDVSVRRAGIIAAVLLPISLGWLIALEASAHGILVDRIGYPVFEGGFSIFLLISSSLAAAAATIWIAAGMRRRVRLLRRDALASPRRGDAVACAIVRHALCDAHRVLMMLYADGRRSLVGIADDVSDDDLRQVWSRSDMSAVPLQSTDTVIPAREERVEPGETIFKWPRPPAYWPTACENRLELLRRLAAVVILPPLATIVGWPILTAWRMNSSGSAWYPFFSYNFTDVILESLKISLVFGMVVSVLAVAVLPLVGMAFGWDRRPVIAGRNGLCFRGYLLKGTYFPWPKVKALVIRLSPYASVRQEIAVIYDYHGIEAVYVRRVSRHFDYEGLVKALAAVTDAAPEAAETPEGLTIRLTGFAEKAPAQGAERVESRE